MIGGYLSLKDIILRGMLCAILICLTFAAVCVAARTGPEEFNWKRISTNLKDWESHEERDPWSSTKDSIIFSANGSGEAFQLFRRVQDLGDNFAIECGIRARSSRAHLIVGGSSITVENNDQWHHVRLIVHKNDTCLLVDGKNPTRIKSPWRTTLGLRVAITETKEEHYAEFKQLQYAKICDMRNCRLIKLWN